MSQEESSLPLFLNDLIILEHFYECGGSDTSHNVVRQLSPFLCDPISGSENKNLMKVLMRKYCWTEKQEGLVTFHLKTEFQGRLPSDILEVDVSTLRRRSRTLPIYEPSEEDVINRLIPPKSPQGLPGTEFEDPPPPLPARRRKSCPSEGPSLPANMGPPPPLPKRKLNTPIVDDSPPSKLNPADRPPLPTKDSSSQPRLRTLSNPSYMHNPSLSLKLLDDERPPLPPKFVRRPALKNEPNVNKKDTFKAQKSVKDIRKHFEEIKDETSPSNVKPTYEKKDLRRRRPSSVVIPQKITPEIQTWLKRVAKPDPDLNPILKEVERNPRILGVQDHLSGYTGLHWLCKHGSFEVMYRLFRANLVHKSDLNARSRGGYTPLILCAIQGHSELYSLLLEQPGLETGIQDYSGKKAKHYWQTNNGGKDAFDGQTESLNEDGESRYLRQDSRTSRGREKVHRGATFLRNVVRQSGRIFRE